MDCCDNPNRSNEGYAPHLSKAGWAIHQHSRCASCGNVKVYLVDVLTKKCKTTEEAMNYIKE